MGELWYSESGSFDSKAPPLYLTIFKHLIKYFWATHYGGKTLYIVKMPKKSHAPIKKNKKEKVKKVQTVYSIHQIRLLLNLTYTDVFRIFK